MDNNLDYTNPGLEDQYRNHKVVAFPHSRGRSSVRDIAAAANNSQQQQQPMEHPPIQRPRSLSAGRNRARKNNGNEDMVQGIYDRMGVNVRRGQVTELNVSTNNHNNTPSYGHVVDDGNNNNNGYPHELPSPPRIVSGAAALEAQASCSEPGGSFQERYRNAVSRGRGGRAEEQAPSNNGVDEELTPRRSRSFSASRITKRWPPEPNNSNFDDQTNNNAYPSGPPPQPTLRHQPTSMHHQQSPSTANNRQRGISPARGLSPKIVVPTPIDAASPGPSWNNNEGHSSNHNMNGPNGNAVYNPSEEKKEDHAEPMAGTTPVSIKDRINAYGKPGRSKSLRNVDPTYAAQFAVRDRPPKIDIYAENNKQQQQLPSAPFTEKQQQETMMENNNNPYGGMVAPLNTAPTQESAGYAGDDYEQVPAQPQQQLSQQLSPVRPGSAHIRQGSKSNLANAFLAKINNGKPQNIPPPTTTTASSSYKVPTPTNAPVVEINVSESGDGGNDINSVAGLSTVSGEEFSAGPSRRANYGGDFRKPTWQRAASFNAPLPPKPVNSNNNSSNTHTPNMNNTYGGVPLTSNNGNSNNNSSNMVHNSEIERLVEERVQARVADLEAEIEHKLRILVGQMEDKIMLRLDTLETKMTAAVTKKK